MTPSSSPGYPCRTCTNPCQQTSLGVRQKGCRNRAEKAGNNVVRQLSMATYRKVACSCPLPLYSRTKLFLIALNAHGAIKLFANVPSKPRETYVQRMVARDDAPIAWRSV